MQIIGDKLTGGLQNGARGAVGRGAFEDGSRPRNNNLTDDRGDVRGGDNPSGISNLSITTCNLFRPHVQLKIQFRQTQFFAESQWIVATRRSERRFRRTDLANNTCLWEPKLLLRVGNRAAGACITSSPDSDLKDCDLETFNHNSAHGSFASLAFQPSMIPIVRINGSSRTRLNYYRDAGITRVKLTCRRYGEAPTPPEHMKKLVDMQVRNRLTSIRHLGDGAIRRGHADVVCQYIKLCFPSCNFLLSETQKQSGSHV
ncbi:unnamed protein product [Microthlaspi erraticum]|uniref:Uncharacterized protein n=1 Tax=Microthlaspi erraticum TaxID=1685480 RepID=A0A6D2KRI2_9BRAS|nr:unnamed protein product [Microthlaspi erraticum]